MDTPIYYFIKVAIWKSSCGPIVLCCKSFTRNALLLVSSIWLITNLFIPILLIIFRKAAAQQITATMLIWTYGACWEWAATACLQSQHLSAEVSSPELTDRVRRSRCWRLQGLQSLVYRIHIDLRPHMRSAAGATCMHMRTRIMNVDLQLVLVRQ